MKIATSICLFIAVSSVGALAYIYSGIYDISATTPHFDFTWRVLRTAMEQSVKRQAKDVKMPELELDDPEKLHMGFKDFHEMCVTCHGGPGTPASEIGKGLYPEAPDLAKAAKAWTPAELYVLTKGGVKMSGMPAWGPTHSEEELWALVAFLKLLPTMPTAEYQGAVEYYAMNAGKTKEMQAGDH